MAKGKEVGKPEKKEVNTSDNDFIIRAKCWVEGEQVAKKKH